MKRRLNQHMKRYKNDLDSVVSNDVISYPNFRLRFLHRFIGLRRPILRRFVSRILRSYRGKK